MSLLDIHQRVGHITVKYGDYILVWGGFKHEEEGEGYYPSDEIWFYHCKTEVWILVHAIGYSPNPNSGSTAVVSDDYLYIFGGVEALPGDISRYSNDLHRLDLKKLVWTVLSPSGVSPYCCDKGVGWTYCDKLYVFGGYGQREGHFTDDHSFDVDNSNLLFDRGWHNQLLIYNPTSNSWSIPKTYGSPPKPRATHTAEVKDHKVYIFGGRTLSGRLNDLHCLDLKSMTWAKLCVKTCIDHVPEGRSWHSFNFISDNHAIVYGGLNSQGFPCMDWWECLINESGVSWIKKGELEKALVWHKAVWSNHTMELLLVGGVTCSPNVMQSENHVTELFALQFSPSSLLRLSLKEVIEHQLWRDGFLPKHLMEAAKARASRLLIP